MYRLVAYLYQILCYKKYFFMFYFCCQYPLKPRPISSNLILTFIIIFGLILNLTSILNITFRGLFAMLVKNRKIISSGAVYLDYILL